MHFSTSQLPKVVRPWCALYLLTWKCASRHNGVHFFNISISKSGPNLVCFVHFDWKCASRHKGVQLFISHLARWLRVAALASLLFNPPEPQIIGKTQCVANFLPFRAPGSSFFRDFLFFDLLSSSLLFSDSSHLCFSSVHIVGSLTSKRPSVIFYSKLFSWLLQAPSWHSLPFIIHTCMWTFFLRSVLDNRDPGA